MTMYTLAVAWRITEWNVVTITPRNGKLMSRYGVQKLDRGGEIGDWRQRMDAHGSQLLKWITLRGRGGKRPFGGHTWSNDSSCYLFAMHIIENCEMRTPSLEFLFVTHP